MASTSYKALLKKAFEAGSRRDYAEAETLLSRIVAETDSLPEAWLFLGRARHALGRHDRALAAFRTYVMLRPDDPSGWFFTGRTYLSIGRTKEAAAFLRSSIAKGRSRADAWTLLGFCELRQRRSAKAVASLEKALEFAPQDTRIFKAYLNTLHVHAIRTMNQGNAREAASIFGFVIANGLDGPAQRLYRARALRTDGRIREAMQELEAAMVSAPEDTGLRLQLAALRFASGDAAGGMAIIRQFGSDLPESSGTPWNAETIDRFRALLALREGDPQSALDAALDRIRAGDADAAIRAVAAQANLELGRYSRAVEHYRRAVEADPSEPDLRVGLSHALLEAGDFTGARAAAKAAAARGASADETRYVETLCDVKNGSEPSVLLPKVQALLRSHPGDPHLLLAYAECLYKTGRPDLADSWFTDVIGIWPDHELSMLYRISVAESLHNDGEAMARYADYLGSYPDNAAVRKDYINLLTRSRSWAQAADAIEGGRAYGAFHSSDQLLALCYRNAGRYHEAAGCYRKILKKSPRDVEALLGLAYSLLKSGAKAIAIELLERGAAYIGKQAEPYLVLGVLHARQGASEKAVSAFLKASELAPADPRPLRNLARLYTKAGVPETASRFDERAKALETRRRSK
jgi:tetratricopeptide (TPR) repeat protein